MARADRKPHLPDKTCATCGRRMEYRKRWRDRYDEVKYCGAACRQQGVGDRERALEAAVLRLLGARPRAASICPSEVARAVAPADWKPLMEPVRHAARRLAAEDRVIFKQGGRVVDPSTAKGAIRLARGGRWRG